MMFYLVDNSTAIKQLIQQQSVYMNDRQDWSCDRQKKTPREYKIKSHHFASAASSCVCHHNYVQSIVLEPCSRLIVQNNEAIDRLRWSVDGAMSTGDVVCIHISLLQLSHVVCSEGTNC